MSITALLSIFSNPAFADNGTPELVSSPQALTDSTPHKSASRVDLSKDKTRVQGQSRHGFRMGYGYVNAPEDHELIKSNWMYLLGYELNQTLYSGGNINVLFVENIAVTGINQSLFIPTGNLLAGFEFNGRFQVASGMNIAPTDNWCHMVVAAGWTPKVGDINIPFHVSYVPDIDNHWRSYLTTGVNW